MVFIGDAPQLFPLIPFFYLQPLVKGKESYSKIKINVIWKHFYNFISISFSPSILLLGKESNEEVSWYRDSGPMKMEKIYTVDRINEKYLLMLFNNNNPIYLRYMIKDSRKLPGADSCQ